MSLKTAIIEDPNEFHSLANEWNELASRFKTPLLRHEWFAACVEAFCPPGKLSVRVLREDDEIVAIAPLIVNPCFGLNRLELLGTSVLHEPSGFLYRDKKDLTNLLNEIQSNRTPILFCGLPSDSPELQYLKSAQPSNRTLSRSSSSASPWLPISTCWDKFLSSMSPKWRSTFRRAERRAAEFGTLQFEVVAPSPETLDRFLAEVLQVEAANWKSRTGTALQSHTTLCHFFRTYSQLTARLGMLRLAFLRIEGKAVAVQLMVECADRLWVLKVGYDESYAPCSPGILLMNKVIQYAFEKQYEAFELLGSNEQWMNIWKPQLHIHEAYRRYPLCPVAIISHGLEVSSGGFGKALTIMKKGKAGTNWTGLIKKIGTRIGRSKVISTNVIS